jgi:hypothetical protein
MALLMAERIDRPLSLFGPGSEDPGSSEHDDGLGGGLTLDDAIVGAWEGLAAQAIVACPLCGGALKPRSSHDDAGGRCGDCGTSLV